MTRWGVLVALCLSAAAAQNVTIVITNLCEAVTGGCAIGDLNVGAASSAIFPGSYSFTLNGTLSTPVQRQSITARLRAFVGGTPVVDVTVPGCGITAPVIALPTLRGTASFPVPMCDALAGQPFRGGGVLIADVMPNSSDFTADFTISQGSDVLMKLALSAVSDVAAMHEDAQNITTDLLAASMRFTVGEELHLYDAMHIHWEESAPYLANATAWQLVQLEPPQVTKQTLAAGQRFAMHCHDPVQCDAFVFFYHQPSTSSATNGGLPTSLPERGWQGGSCAPSFSLPSVSSECTYPMTGFRRIIPAGSVAHVHIRNKKAMYVVPVLTASTPCSAKTREECERKQNGRLNNCAFVDGKCVDNWCHKPPRTSSTRKNTSCAPANSVRIIKALSGSVRE